MKVPRISSVSVMWDNVLSTSLTEIEPEVMPFRTFSKIKIIWSLFSERRILNGFSTNFVKIVFCSLSKEDAYSYRLNGREIFVNCVSMIFLIFNFWVIYSSNSFLRTRYFW